MLPTQPTPIPPPERDPREPIHPRISFETCWFPVQLWRATQGHCYYCGYQPPVHARSVDLIIPAIKLGLSTPDNMVPCCMACIGLKHGLRLEEFRTRMQLRAQPEFTRAQTNWLNQQGFKPKPFEFWFEQQGLTSLPLITPLFKRKLALNARYNRFCHYAKSKGSKINGN